MGICLFYSFSIALCFLHNMQPRLPTTCWLSCLYNVMVRQSSAACMHYRGLAHLEIYMYVVPNSLELIQSIYKDLHLGKRSYSVYDNSSTYGYARSITRAWRTYTLTDGSQPLTRVPGTCWFQAYHYSLC